MASRFYLPEYQPYLWRKVRIRDSRGRLTRTFRLALRRIILASRCDDDVSALMALAEEIGRAYCLLPAHLVTRDDVLTAATA